MVVRENMRRNAIQVRELVYPTRGLRNHLLKKYKKLKFEVRDLLKFKKATKTNIMCLHLTLIVA